MHSVTDKRKHCATHVNQHIVYTRYYRFRRSSEALLSCYITFVKHLRVTHERRPRRPNLTPTSRNTTHPKQAHTASRTRRWQHPHPVIPPPRCCCCCCSYHTSARAPGKNTKWALRCKKEEAAARPPPPKIPPLQRPCLQNLRRSPCIVSAESVCLPHGHTKGPTYLTEPLKQISSRHVDVEHTKQTVGVKKKTSRSLSSPSPLVFPRQCHVTPHPLPSPLPLPPSHPSFHDQIMPSLYVEIRVTQRSHNPADSRRVRSSSGRDHASERCAPRRSLQGYWRRSTGKVPTL